MNSNQAVKKDLLHFLEAMQKAVWKWRIYPTILRFFKTLQLSKKTTTGYQIDGQNAWIINLIDRVLV